MRRLLAVVLVVILAVVLVVVLTGSAPPCSLEEQRKRCAGINEYRASREHPRPALIQRAGLQADAQGYARELAELRVLRHETVAELDGAAEIIGYGPDWRTIMRAWKDSTPHRRILLDRDLERVGIGTYRDPLGTLWAVVRFR